MQDKKSIQQQIDEKIITVKDFALSIETFVNDKKIGYLDALTHYADQNNVEIETIASLVKNSHVLKAKLAAESEGKKLLKASGNKLPI